jgi:outer membrane protein OmpA-like peptidoglycan-associated protein
VAHSPAKPRPRVARAAPPPAPVQAAPVQAPAANPYLGAPNLSNVFGAQPKLASAAPPPAAPSGGEAGLIKRSVILFAKDAADPAEGALGAIKFLAGDLNAAMTRAASRVELQAYGGAKGDKSSDARRLALKRALAIRQVLITDGVSADRIDVRAMGGADDAGPADRVDVFVRT